MTCDTSSRWCKALHGAVGVLSVACAAVAFWLTRTDWFRSVDGEWHVRAVKAALVALPVSILLFAFGVQWLARRRPWPALAALLPLPIWIACLHLTRLEVPQGAQPGTEAALVNGNLLVNDAWMAIVISQMQGIAPFGPS